MSEDFNFDNVHSDFEKMRLGFLEVASVTAPMMKAYREQGLSSEDAAAMVMAIIRSSAQPPEGE